MTMLCGMPLENQTRVLLADYPGPGGTAIATLVDGLRRATLVGTVVDPEQILHVLGDTEPDVVILDDRMLRDARWLAEGLPARLIVMGVDDDPAYRRRAERIGAETWLAKDRADAVLPALLADRPALTPPG